MKQPLIIDQQKCTGCGQCLAACPFGALRMEGRLAVVTPELCCACGACVKVCPVAAIALAAAPTAAPDALRDFKDIWVFAEQCQGQLHESAFELLGVARRLADERGCRLAAVVLGAEIAHLSAPLIAAGADRVYLADNRALAAYEAGVYAEALSQLIARHQPEVVLAAATAVGRGFFAKTAIRAHTGLTADCTALSIDQEHGWLVQTRPAFGGSIMAKIITPNHRPQMATVRPHVFKKNTPDLKRRGEILVETLQLAAPATRILKSMRSAGGFDLAEAEIIVAGGRGLRKAASFTLLEQLAERLGGVVGASRTCVDAGWIPATHQVGQTGRTVCPRVYLAFGISGAVQHLEGMRSSEYIIAINSDPQAPIFDVADLAVTGDLFEIIPLLIQAL